VLTLTSSLPCLLLPSSECDVDWHWSGQTYPHKRAIVHYLRKDGVLYAKLFKLGTNPWQIALHTKRYAAEAQEMCEQKLAALAKQRMGL
jgi:hypothetical protein